MLVTGAAGFIGFHAVNSLVAAGAQVTGLDEFNSYYDVALKEARLTQLERAANSFRCERFDCADHERLLDLVRREKPEFVLHLAAQAGVLRKFRSSRFTSSGCSCCTQ